MKARAFTTMGALHPILFFAGVYIVALIFSIFICSSLFYSCHSAEAKADVKKAQPEQQTATLSKNESSVVLK